MDDIWIILAVVGIILLIVYLYKWGPNKNRNKIVDFLGLVDTLNGSYTMQEVIAVLPYKPTTQTDDTLTYYISKVTEASFDGRSASSTTSTIHLEMQFVNNRLYAIYKVLPDGKKLTYKIFSQFN